MRKGIEIVIVREEEADDVLIFENKDAAGLFIDFIDVVVIHEEEVVVNAIPLLLFLDAFVLFLIKFILDRYCGV